MPTQSTLSSVDEQKRRRSSGVRDGLGTQTKTHTDHMEWRSLMISLVHLGVIGRLRKSHFPSTIPRKSKENQRNSDFPFKSSTKLKVCSFLVTLT